MFTRIVKMEFQEDQIVSFLANFETVKHNIRHFKGCLHLELWRDKHQPTVFFTYSKWEKESDLESYRNSELFKGVWAKIKPMFVAKANAWSVDTYSEVAG